MAGRGGEGGQCAGGEVREDGQCAGGEGREEGECRVVQTPCWERAASFLLLS